jgi:hypothetical protein
MQTKNKYAFQTIVAPAAVRAEFTALRDQLDTKDKVLMQAFWNIGIDFIDKLKEEVENIKNSIQAERAEVREMKAAAKKAPKAAKPKKVAAKKGAKASKAKAPKVDESGFEVVYNAADDEDNA